MIFPWRALQSSSMSDVSQAGKFISNWFMLLNGYTLLPPVCNRFFFVFIEHNVRHFQIIFYVLFTIQAQRIPDL